MANTPLDFQQLPESFCVEIKRGQSNGYAYLRTELVANITILRPKLHSERFFRIINNRPYVLQHQSTWKTTEVRKGSGSVNRTMRWRNTGVALRYNGIDYPVLKMNATATILPTIGLGSFIPIVVEGAPAAPAAPAAPVTPAPAPAAREKKYPILTIPQHVVRALLRDAAMQEEVCAITGDEIDITNGAVTSCFHMFDKNSIAKWLLMPNSQQKCPVCNTQCNSYRLDDVPPPLDVS